MVDTGGFENGNILVMDLNVQIKMGIDCQVEFYMNQTRPSGCKPDALPTELSALKVGGESPPFLCCQCK